MNDYLGILFALGALLSWGVGDFLIQRTTRLVGDVKTLFFIEVVGAFVFLPFAWSEFLNLTSGDFVLLVVVSIVILFGALFDFEALKQGKIAIVEPVIGIELPLTVGLSMIILGERPHPAQLLLLVAIFIGIVLAVTAQQHHLHYHRRLLEKGVILAGIGAIGMALTNFLFGFSSQVISPLVTIWFTSLLLAAYCAAYLIYQGEFYSLGRDLRRHPAVILEMSFLDNAAWLAFGFAATLIPISIAAGISESYIALAVLLGVFVNREKLKSHQVAGVILTTVAVVLLSFISEGG